MPSQETDRNFPACCTSCPHLEQVTASCTHELRQSLIREIDTKHTCPVYSDVKTRSMSSLSSSL